MKSRMKIISLMLAVIMAFGLLSACSGKKEQEKYTVYFGLNDADEGSQILTVDEAKEQLRALWIEKGVGYTEYIVYGAYPEDGKVKGNDTVVYELFFVKKADVETVVSKAKKQLNLDSVLINEEKTSYYYGE